MTTTDAGATYVGKIYKSLVADNTGDPLESFDWRQIDVVEFSNPTIYSNGDIVSSLETHNKYMSMEDNNDTSPLNPDSKWQFIGKTNQCDFTDFYFSTVTEVINQDIITEFTFDNADHLSLFGVFGSTITVKQLDYDDPEIVLKTDVLSRIDTSMIEDFATYLQFQGCGDVSSFQVDLIEKVNMRVELTIEHIAYEGYDIAELATLTVGRKLDVGCTLYGIKSTRTAITEPSYDKWGEVDLLGDDFIKTFTGKMEFDSKNIDHIDYIIDSLFNQPAVYLLTDGEQESFNTYGLMTVGELSLDTALLSGLPLKIKSFKYRRNTKSCLA